MDRSPASSPAASAPRLGVIMCNYNDAATLPRALDAVLHQSRPPDEIVIVEDGSTDDSARILSDYANKHSHIRVLTNDRNRGLIYSTRRALESSTAEFVYSGSANDYALPGFFARAVALLQEHPQADLAFGGVIFKDQVTGQEIVRRVDRWKDDGYHPPAEFLSDYLEAGDLWASLGPSCIYRRSLLAAAGKQMEDLESYFDTFVSNMLGLKNGVCYVHEPCCVFFFGGDSFSRRQFSDPHKRIRLLQRWASRMREKPEIFPADYVERWEQSRMESVLAEQCGQFRHHVWQARVLIEALSPGRRRLPVKIIHLLSSLLIRIGESQIRRSLRRPGR
jgi:glycosyltransferase involved in cell wall biosynthesis